MSVSGFHRVKTEAELKQSRLTLSGGSGTIKEAESSPRKSLSGNAFAVNWSEVQSESYKSRLLTLSSDEKVVDSILTRATWALNNRDGLNTEEIYAVSLVDGREIARITDLENYKGEYFMDQHDWLIDDTPVPIPPEIERMSEEEIEAEFKKRFPNYCRKHANEDF